MSVSLSHYRILVPAFVLTHVITKNLYKVNLHYVRRSCAAAELHDWMTLFYQRIRGKCGIRYPHYPDDWCFYWFFFWIIDWIALAHSISSLQRFTNAAQRCINTVYRPYGHVWLFCCIFTTALLQLSVSLLQGLRSHKNALLQRTENSVRATFLQRSLQR